MKQLKIKLGTTALFTIVLCSIALTTSAQDTSKVYFTTAVGILLPASKFSNAYDNSLALNSGIEYRFSKRFFTQFVLDFNAVKYNQKIKDENSSYLFQNTNSSVFLLGINVGANLPLSANGKLFCSPYLGLGYANIGEPRLSVNNSTGIIKQDVTRMQGVFGRGGGRIGFRTNSKFLQTIYVDASYWSASIKVQQSTPQAVALLLGTRIGF